MDNELRDILERGLDLVYDGDGYLKRWEWRDSLAENLKKYFERKAYLDKQEKWNQEFK